MPPATSFHAARPRKSSNLISDTSSASLVTTSRKPRSAVIPVTLPASISSQPRSAPRRARSNPRSEAPARPEPEPSIAPELAARDKEIKRLATFKTNLEQQVLLLAEKLALSESVVRNVPEPLLIIDLDGLAIYANPHCCELAQRDRRDIERKLTERQGWRLAESSRSPLEECMRQRKPILGVRLTVDRQPRPITLVVSATPRTTSTGEIKGAFAIYRDITEELRLTEELVAAGDQVTEVHTTAAQISTAAQEQVTTATEQSTTVTQVSTTTTELATAAKQVADSCSAIAASSVQLLHSARTGQELLDKVLSHLDRVREMTRLAGEQIFGLSDKSKRVSAIVDLIHTVAAETKLISFNAAIEAARAGDAGRGFGVVATEVKSLAESVAESGTEIKNLVNDIQSSVNRSVLTAEGQVKLVEEVADMARTSDATFGEIVEEIEQIADRASVISVSTQQQRNATDQLSVSMEELTRAAGHSATAAKQTMQAVGQLTEFARRLGAALRQFKQGG